MLEKDISDNRSIGEFGAKAILSNISDSEQVRVLTHCNTGSLATAYFGTALGVVRCLHSASRLGKILKKDSYNLIFSIQLKVKIVFIIFYNYLYFILF